MNGTEIAKFKFMTLNEQTAMDVKNQKSQKEILSVMKQESQLRVFTEEMSEDR
jgi:hypothetical protein